MSLCVLSKSKNALHLKKNNKTPIIIKALQACIIAGHKYILIFNAKTINRTRAITQINIYEKLNAVVLT